MLKIKGVCLLLCLLLAMQAVQGLADGAAWQGDNEWAVTLNYADGVSRNGTIFVDRNGSVMLFELSTVNKHSIVAGLNTSDMNSEGTGLFICFLIIVR